MITPISNNLNTNSLSSIERPRIPRRFNPSNNVGFRGNNKTSETNSFSDSFLKSVQSVKNGAKRAFYITVNTVRNIPSKIGGFFNGIANKVTKKA